MCYHPWVGLDISPQGEFKPCCKYQNDIAGNLTDYLASDELASLKQSFLAGEKPQACHRCWSDEAAGLPSKRQLDNIHVFNNQQPQLDSFKVLSLPFGNSCNLACRICSGFASSTWIAEAKKLQQHVPNIKIYKHQRFYQDAEFIKQIQDHCGDVVHVEFPGGEPFLAGVKEHIAFLDFLLAHTPSDISLHYITNGTIFPNEEFWSRWSKFKKVDLQLSIDGTGQQFEYNRWPASWTEVEANIAKYLDKRSLHSNIQLSVSHSVSIFTVFYLPEFVKWCLQNKLDRPYLGLVDEPKRYNIKSLPKQIKDKISEKITRFKFENVVQYMNSEDLSEEFPETIDWINWLDQQRNQDFKQAFPEFTKLLEDSYA